MKIARIIPYFKSSFGGPVNHLKKIILGMQNLDIKNYIYTVNFEKKNFLKIRNRFLTSNEINIFKFVPLLKIYHFFFTPQMVIELVRNQFDIIDLNCVRNFQVDLTLLFYSIFRRNVPILLNTHGTMSTPDISKFRYLFKKAYLIFFEKFLLKRVNYFLVVSKLEKESLIKQKIPAEKILVILHGKDLLIDSDKILSGNFRKKHNLEKETILISCVGRIFEGKGIQYLLKSVPFFKNNIKKFKVVIAGKDDGYLNQLIRITKDLKIEDHIIFTGNLSKTDNSLWELYKDTNVLISPSLSESFGHIFMEGISFNLPIIYSNENNLFLEDEISGVYVPFGNYKLIAKKIIQLTEDKNRVERLIINSQNARKNLPLWEEVFQKHYNLYRYLKSRTH